MAGARHTVFVVVALAAGHGCRGESNVPAGRGASSEGVTSASSPRQAASPSASTSGAAEAPSAGSASHPGLDDGMALGRPEADVKMEKAVASMRGCKADKDCVVVRVSCGAQAAVAATSKAAAEKAMLEQCPSAGSGGWNGPPPEVKCATGKCELQY